jgi:hypothetical protein
MARQEVQLTLEYVLPAKQRVSRVYIYVVDRDFGFAPNPFHGFCTLATCKPGIRNTAKTGDWVIGMGGNRLNATGRCVFAMQISGKITYNEYWLNHIYFDKKPVRNGSCRMMVGDNIYYLEPTTSKWNQADSHHSNPDGTINAENLNTDTKSDKVLISRRFFYFGRNAPLVPPDMIANIGFKNGIGHRVYERGECAKLIDWLEQNFGLVVNTVHGDPYDFEISDKRYSGKGSKII